MGVGRGGQVRSRGPPGFSYVIPFMFFLSRGRLINGKGHGDAVIVQNCEESQVFCTKACFCTKSVSQKRSLKVSCWVRIFLSLPI